MVARTNHIIVLVLAFVANAVLAGQLWTPSGRRKYVEELLPTQSCYVTEVSILLFCYFIHILKMHKVLTLKYLFSQKYQISYSYI
jgi:hypothetical protein